MMDVRILASQKHRDVLPAFWPRKLSPYITSLLLQTAITPNQTTVLWGVISAANSYLVYLVLTGHYLLLPVIPVAYVFTYVLDCVDGEIARVRNMANPVGGKLLDGICHRATEYSLLVAYVCAAARLTTSPWVPLIGLLLVSGEAMQTYAYERRLTTMRIHVGFKGLIAASDDGVYQRGERWSSMSTARRLATLKGQIHHKSIYAVVLVSYLSPDGLLLGLAALALYKHIGWMRLIARTLADAHGAAEAAPPGPSVELTHDEPLEHASHG